MKAPVVSIDQEKVGEVELLDSVFDTAVRADLMHRTVTWQLAKRRQGTHKVKTRSENNRTKKKFGRQKGGGGARHGSRNAHIFIGGGQVHGPTSRDHGFDLQKKVRKAALRSALSAKQQGGQLIILDDAKLESGRTRDLADKLAKFDAKSILFVTGAEVDAGFARAAQNLIGIDVLPQQGANVYDILKHDALVLTKDAAAALEERLS
jgi:large subunit ribosomal protein L4